ncbi:MULTISPECIES: GNAT family N-acetyltransferase [unclassified Streptomyces]|uniref:GNAT family N-acetyltransferase n=1 Tax=unclassified Streptomyces TaxID=2593676 RepID=UPI002DDAE9D1|nr:GNAT family N-acetyltransferase [Streptomyces sp. NBC_01766]WSC18314.1 GNAT family N-acetyltransferase [Streptomyces sp. NBC_01766]
MEANTREAELAAVRTPPWSLRSASSADVETIAELRATVMRPDLERLGRFDEHRVRQRLRDSFSAQYTSVIVVGGALAGCVTLRPAPQGQWLESFYLDPGVQGRGLGSAVLRTLLERTDAEGVPVRLHVLQGSAARRLYERHGFTVEDEDPVDVHMVRRPGACVTAG